MKFRAIILSCTLVVLSSTAFGQRYLVEELYDNNEGAGMYFSYVNQYFDYKFENGIVQGSGIWNNRQRLHGFAFGAVDQSHWNYGIGLYYGFNMEMYMSFNSPTGTDYAETTDEAFDSYVEMTFQAPLHLAFKLPLIDDFAVGVHTGPGLTFTYIGLFSDSRGYFEDWSLLGDGGLDMFNLTYDFALYAELFSIRIDLQWSSGLFSQNMGTGWDSVKRNKFALGLTYFFN